jgi:hypothetical protein
VGVNDLSMRWPRACNAHVGIHYGRVLFENSFQTDVDPCAPAIRSASTTADRAG